MRECRAEIKNCRMSETYQTGWGWEYRANYKQDKPTEIHSKITTVKLNKTNIKAVTRETDLVYKRKLK